MTRSVPARWFVLLLALVLAPAPAPAREPCAALEARLQEALRGGDIPSVAAAAIVIRGSIDACDPAVREQLLNAAALAHVRAAREGGSAGMSLEHQLALLRAGQQLAQPWQLFAAIGDVLGHLKGADGRTDHVAVSAAYQAALRGIAVLPSSAPRPPREIVDRFVRRAAQARALAPVFVRGDDLITRAPGGVEASAVPVPVHFEFNRPLGSGPPPGTADMTDLGRQYAEEAVRLLRKGSAGAALPRIRLVGHTDPVGSNAFNQALGLRRAEALRAVFVANGYDAGLIEVASLGEVRPAAIENADTLSEGERHAVLRRVVICFLDKSEEGDGCR